MPDNVLPSTYKHLKAHGSARQGDAFDPALKHYARALRPGEPAFDDQRAAERWSAARRAAMEHLLEIIATSRWSEHLVLRGSVLLRGWLGNAARDPGDVDFVVTPQTMMLDDRRTRELLDGLVAAVRQRPEVAPDLRILDEVAITDIWTYERAPGRRIVFGWSTSDAQSGGVQLDFVFNERLPLPAARTQILRADGQAPISILAAGPALSLAWKILWLETDFYPQGKDLYDATLLAERTYLPGELLREVLSRELGAEAEAFTADRVLAWQVDWDNFVAEYPWVVGTPQQWQSRLHRALQGTFAA
jgi:hypothetical protein